jgi:HSP20 family protein
MLPIMRQNSWLPTMFNDLFDDNDWIVKTNATTPAINVIESENDYKVEVAAPGMTKDDFKIHVTEDDNLEISLEKKVENKEADPKNKKHYLRREFSYEKFQQTLILPDDVEKDKISASVADGVLNVVIPKKVAETKAKVARQIEVK